MCIMTKYKADIKKASLNKEKRYVTNKGANYAAILMTELISQSTLNIKIYSRMLNVEVTSQENFVGIFQTILEKGVSVQIILEENCNNQELVNLFDNYQNLVQIKMITIEGLEKINEIFDNDTHFSIYDNCAYRLETDIQDYKAFGSFNDVDFTNKLNILFDDLFENYTV